ncbi:thiol-disulfide isomerase/thioredoxin [Chitinophaga polysaccharea]|uniref:Thiol-disulfide isomerase/thioredoxin n=1 Tax=Chitinophaga polysaccharea TaxID=1293035 RepID=A0A561PN91_9BACT|nr:thiol-disulfide isomerase/thioredoxin [Chitinophaga polysaccharea]
MLSISCYNLAKGTVSSKKEHQENTPRHGVDSVIILFHLSPGEIAHFFYQDDYNDLFRATQRTDDSGYLRMALYIPHNLVITFTNLMTVYPALVIPGDSLIVRKLYQNDQTSYEFQSTKHIYANFLNELEKKYGFFYGSLQLSPDMNIEYYLKEIKNRNAQRLQLLREYGRIDTTGSSLASYLRKEIRSVYIMDFCAPYYTKNFNYREKVPPEYTNELGTLLNELNCDTCVTSPKYRLAIRNYLLYLTRDSLSGNNEFTTMFRNAYSSFTGKSRDVALFITMKSYLEKDNSEAISHLPYFDTKCVNTGYRRYIDSLVKRESRALDSTEGSNSMLSDLTGITIPFKSIISEQKGKIVLLDFWASWCGPCRAETPAMKALIEKYQKEDLTVIFISIDDNKDKWATAVDQLGIKTAGKHYLLDSKQPLCRLVGIPPIPRYILIDQSGRITAFNAPRPSESELSLKIEKLLHNNSIKITAK